MNVYKKQKQTYRERKQTCGYQREREGRRDKSGVLDQQIQTTTCKTDKQQDTLFSTGNYTHFLIIIYNGI